MREERRGSRKPALPLAPIERRSPLVCRPPARTDAPLPLPPQVVTSPSCPAPPAVPAGESSPLPASAPSPAGAGAASTRPTNLTTTGAAAGVAAGAWSEDAAPPAWGPLASDKHEPSQLLNKTPVLRQRARRA